MPGEAKAVQPNSVVSDLIAAFLVDLARAQHQSNLFSAELGEIYRSHPLLRVFPVPNGCITEINLDLKIAVDGVMMAEISREAVLHHGSVAVSDQVAWLGPQAADRVATKLKKHREAFAEPEKAERMAEAIRTAPLLESLIRQVTERVLPRLGDLVSGGGELREQAAAEVLASAFVQIFVNHPDYQPLPEAQRRGLDKEIESLIGSPEAMDRLRARLAERPERSEPRMVVATSGEAVSAAGQNALGSIHIEAGVRDYLVEGQEVPGSSQPGSPQIVRFRLVPAKD